MNPVKVVNTVWAGRTGFPMDLDVMRIMLNKHELVRRIDVQRATTIKQLKSNRTPVTITVNIKPLTLYTCIY